MPARPRREVYLENGRVRRHPYRRGRQRCRHSASASRADTRLVCFDTKRTLSVNNHTARSVDPCYGLWGPPTLGQKWATPGTVLGGRPLGGAAKTICPFQDNVSTLIGGGSSTARGSFNFPYDAYSLRAAKGLQPESVLLVRDVAPGLASQGRRPS
jgi:hypothetical protein